MLTHEQRRDKYAQVADWLQQHRLPDCQIETSYDVVGNSDGDTAWIIRIACPNNEIWYLYDLADVLDGPEKGRTGWVGYKADDDGDHYGEVEAPTAAEVVDKLVG